jgi:membrane associated rhomboid family serine protease
MQIPRATIALLVLIVVAYLVQFGVAVVSYSEGTGAGIGESAMVSVVHDPVDSYIRLGAIVPKAANLHDSWRLVAALFLHAGLLHLLFNGWALLQFGALFERLFGSTAMLLVYFVAGISASAASASWITEGCSLGASGAIFGIVGGLVALVGHGTEGASWGGVVRAQLLLWAIVTIALGLTSVAIDNVAHVTGFVVGLVIGLTLRLLSGSVRAVRRRIPRAAPQRPPAP